MDSTQIIGYAVSVVITLGSFVAVIMKFVQPINDLRVVIQKLNDNIDSLKNDNKSHDDKLAKHEKEINDLGNRVDKMEFKMDLFHKEGEN